MKLRELVDQYGANGVVVADQGTGSSHGEKGRFVSWGSEVEAAYGELEMSELSEPHRSEDGFDCLYTSAWQQQAAAQGFLTGHEFRLYF